LEEAYRQAKDFNEKMKGADMSLLDLDLSPVNTIIQEYEKAQADYQEIAEDRSRIMQGIPEGSMYFIESIFWGQDQSYLGLIFPFKWSSKGSLFEQTLTKQFTTLTNEENVKFTDLERKPYSLGKNHKGEEKHLVKYQMLIETENTDTFQETIRDFTFMLKQLPDSICDGRVELVMAHKDRLEYDTLQKAVRSDPYHGREHPDARMKIFLDRDIPRNRAGGIIEQDEFSIEEISDLLDVSENRVYHYTRAGRLKAIEGSRPKLYSRRALEDFLSTHKRKGNLGWVIDTESGT
jgi:hypothetical protein